MKEALLVFLGGGIGSISRYWIAYLFKTNTASFPTATFLVNAIGCFLIGLLIGYFAKIDHTIFKLLLVTGFCGGFTTFSAFSIESILLLKNHQYSIAIFYISGSLVIGLLATFLGYFISTKII